MPEGPEVKRNTDFLNRELSGKMIEHMAILSGRYETHGPFKGYDEMLRDIASQVEQAEYFDVWSELSQYPSEAILVDSNHLTKKI